MDWHPWNDLFAALLDNYPGRIIKCYVVSRPIPLEYLRLGSFEGQPESRKERSEEGGILDNLIRAQYEPTAYIDLRLTRLWVQIVREGFQRCFFYGIAAAGGKKLMAVGCGTGIFVGLRGDTNFRKILSYGNPSSIIVLQDFNKFIVHHESYLLAYSLDLLARVALYQAPPSSLDASLEKIAGGDGTVLFCCAGRIKMRAIIVYALKSFFQVTVHVMEACSPSDLRCTPPSRTFQGLISSFRPFGETLYVPKDAYSITPLAKTIAISTEKGIVIADPSNTTKQMVSVVPDFSGAASTTDMAQLKTLCEEAKPLGLIRTESGEIMVIYDALGCYITKHGVPSRKSGFIRWETKATAFAHRGSHVLLFSSEFIEIRHISTGRLDQVIEGFDIRLLLHTNLKSKSSDDTLLVAMRGDKDDKEGVSDKIIELVQTSEISAMPTPMTSTPTESLWDEWDM